MEHNAAGIKFCAKFAYPPNLYHYCGPEKQVDLAGYIEGGIFDLGLTEILEKFETLYPYLKYIAGVNQIRDPFQPRVVEAYWLGNHFLDQIKPAEFYRFIQADLKKPTKIANRVAEGIPFHTFHVLNIFRMSGRQTETQIISTMDNCRIRSGKIIKVLGDGTYLTRTDGLSYDTELHLSKNNSDITTTGFGNYNLGDQVAIHWGHICAKLSKCQSDRLIKYTQVSLSYFNQNHLIKIIGS